MHEDNVGISAYDPFAEDNLFRRWSTKELLADPARFEWLIKGFMAAPTYGPIGGEKKSLKSYVSTFINVALASGKPLFGEFAIPQAAPVLSYVGEGGQVLYTNRLRRVAHAMDVRLPEIPLETSFDVAPIMSDRFQQSLERDLKEVRPKLVSVDPLYMFHGSDVPSGDLYKRAQLLNSLSRPIMEAGASLTLLDHFNKKGKGNGLERITQSGMQEWADSWVLINHRELPDVANGAFRLWVELGSRQWGGSLWKLDLNIGRFDEDLGDHVGDIAWVIERADSRTVTVDHDSNIALILEDQSWKLTKNQVLKEMGGNREAATEALDEALSLGNVLSRKLKREEGGRKVTRELLGLAGEPTPAEDV